MFIYKKIIITVMSILLCNSYLGAAWFGHDRAVYAGQQDDWEKAMVLLDEQLVTNPDKANLFYDAGVASYKTGDSVAASAYFRRVTELEDVETVLKEQAHFNLGNAFVERKQLGEAVDQYEQVLALNSENERAQHNIEIVKKMLEEQKKEEQQQEQKQQNEQQQQDEKQNEEKNNDEQQEQGSKDQSQQTQQNDQHGEGSKNNDAGDSQSEQSGTKDKQDNDGELPDKDGSKQQDNQQQGEVEHDKSEVEREQDRGGHEDNQTEQESERQRDNSSHGDTHDNKQNQEQDKNDHQGTPSDKQEASQQSSASEQHAQGDTQEKAQESFNKLDAWLANILDEQEKKDAEQNKKMIKATVGKQLAGQEGENCW